MTMMASKTQVSRLSFIKMMITPNISKAEMLNALAFAEVKRPRFPAVVTSPSNGWLAAIPAERQA